MSTIQMGNDEFILHLRKQNGGPALDNDVLGRRIWQKIHSLDDQASQVEQGVTCLWNRLPEHFKKPQELPQNSTQFSLDPKILPELYRWLHAGAPD